MKEKLKSRFILVLILFFAAAFRLYNINWDGGHYLHPDERAIIMKVNELKFPESLNEFMSPESSWNPKFFAYGSFPMYLLRVTGNALSMLDPQLGQYASLNILGRVISALADVISVGLIFLIASKLFNKKTGLLAAAFYAIGVLPIQLSHFYAVDTLLTCFILATLYAILNFYEKPAIKTSLLVGVFFGLSLATKISAAVLLASIGTALAADFFLVFLKNPHRPKKYLPHLPKSAIHLLKYGFVILISTLATFILLEPYALIDFNTFWQQTTEQSALTINPFYFPYTLQFVGKIPYLYELKNVFLYGLGPILATLSFLGFFYFAYLLTKKQKAKQTAQELIIFIFFVSYVFIVGKFAVGFMRYMLPVYPLFTVFAGLLAYRLGRTLNGQIKNKLILNTCYLILSTSILLWPLSFMQVYNRPNPRIQASNWIYANVAPDKTIAVEHWDDQLPIGQPTSYPITTLKLYDPDTEEKWNEINQQLAATDYIIIASNRLYVPLQRLTDCSKLPTYRCYPRTAEYYKDLFSGNLGFQKVAEFTNHPTVPFFNIPINDQSADENFTVFDHPKVMIFKKTSSRSTM
jgi:hypothetical protein